MQLDVGNEPLVHVKAKIPCPFADINFSQSVVSNRAWRINRINKINNINRINNRLMNPCKLGLGLIPINNRLIQINDGLIQINDRLIRINGTFTSRY